MGHEASFESLAHELVVELMRIERRITARERNSIHGEMGVMWALYQAEEPLTPGELAEATRLTSARVANILRALEEKGWVVRRHSSADRRRVEVSLTPEGRRVHDGRRQERDRRLAAFLRELGADDAAQLVRIVRKARALVEDAVREGDGEARP